MIGLLNVREFDVPGVELLLDQSPYFFTGGGATVNAGFTKGLPDFFVKEDRSLG
jgi:hypothetical protein